jgi:hypothetical protein
MSQNTEEVYRLVDKKTGSHLKAYQGQYVYSTLGVARSQMNRFNKKAWRQEEAVIQRGLIQWSEDPV